MARRVSRSQHRREACKLLAVAYAPHAIQVRLQIDPRARPVALHPGLIVGNVGPHPELGLGLMDDDFGVRIVRIAGIVDQAVGMIGMQMRDHDMGDGARRNSCRAQVVRQLAQCRLHGVAGAGVDQDDLAVAADKKIIDRDIKRAVIRFADQTLSLRPIHADDEVERGLENAVAQARDFDAACAQCGQRHVKGPLGVKSLAVKALLWRARSCSRPQQPRRTPEPRTE